MTDLTEHKAMGFKDMHPDQVEALTRLIGHALSAAEEEHVPSLLESAEDVVVLFGGVGIEVTYDVDY